MHGTGWVRDKGTSRENHAAVVATTVGVNHPSADGSGEKIYFGIENRWRDETGKHYPCIRNRQVSDYILILIIRAYCQGYLNAADCILSVDGPGIGSATDR